MENNTTIRLNVLVSKYEEELEALKKKKAENGFKQHQMGYNNGKLDGEIHQLGLYIRDLKQILKGAENEQKQI